MLIRIGKFDITECWDGVFYKKLSRYPEITAWEIQTVLDFIRYEKDNGRTCTIEADRKIINAIDRYRQTYDQGIRVSPPEKIEECTACPKYRGRRLFPSAGMHGKMKKRSWLCIHANGRRG